MKRFAYTASDAAGKALGGSLWARGLADARQELLRRGLLPIRLLDRDGPISRMPGNHARRLVVLRSLVTHLSAGVPVRRALTATERLALGREVTAAVTDARRLVAEGEGLAVALQRTGLVRSSIGAMIRSGERSGELVEAINHAVAQLEYESAVLSRMRAALTYPAFLFGTATVSFAIIGLVVLPRFAEIVKDVGAQPPVLARQVLRASSLIHAHATAVALGIALSAVIGALVLVHAPYRERLAQTLLRMPVAAGLHSAWSSAVAARGLAAMLRAGMPANRALEIVADNSPSPTLRAQLRAAHVMVSEGQQFSRSLASTGVVPERIVPLLEVGEKTAQLGEMLMRAGHELEREATEAFDRVIGLLQPSIVLVFGGLIALVAALVLQTLYSVRPAL